MKTFALIGAAGYIAPRHMDAIKQVGGNLIAALDPHDSVGVLDNYFPNCNFFTEFERFDRHLEKLKRAGIKIDYLVICSPNYLHDAHCRYGLKNNMDVICEKPLVINHRNLEALEQFESSITHNIYNIMQLRLHPSIKALKDQVKKRNKIHYQIDLKYISCRGKWYDISWKGNQSKSGGIITNIGIHLFDLLIWIFGDIRDYTILKYEKDLIKGVLEMNSSKIDWLLSTDIDQLPYQEKSNGQRILRNMTINGESLEFGDTNKNLHVESYHKILKGQGFKIRDIKKALALTSDIRKTYGEIQT